MGGAAQLLGTGTVPNLSDIAVADDEVYYIAGGEPGQGSLGTVGAGTMVVLASNLTNPHSIAIDSDYVYWTESGTAQDQGVVKRMAR